MTMTPEEICRDYRGAAQPLKQIGILADLNQCSKDEIKRILIAGGCELPGNMRPKAKKAPEAVLDVGMAAKPITKPRKSVTLVAFDLICELADYEGYDRVLPGVVALVRALREEGYE